MFNTFIRACEEKSLPIRGIKNENDLIQLLSNPNQLFMTSPYGYFETNELINYFVHLIDNTHDKQRLCEIFGKHIHKLSQGEKSRLVEPVISMEYLVPNDDDIYQSCEDELKVSTAMSDACFQLGWLVTLCKDFDEFLGYIKDADSIDAEIFEDIYAYQNA